MDRFKFGAEILLLLSISSVALAFRSHFVQEDYVRDFLVYSGPQAIGYIVDLHSTRGCLGIYISRIEWSPAQAVTV